MGLSCCNPRDYTSDRHRTVDDRPYGGGPGMLMKIDPLQRSPLPGASGAGRASGYLPPQGRLTTAKAVDSARQPGLVDAGRYEGVDERLLTAEVDEELSIGDYAERRRTGRHGGDRRSGRNCPGCWDNELSARKTPSPGGCWIVPPYPAGGLPGRQVPDVLLSGNHEQIRRWRLKQDWAGRWSGARICCRQGDDAEESSCWNISANGWINYRPLAVKLRKTHNRSAP